MFRIPRWTAKATPVANRVAEVGWIVDTDQAGFIWEAPRKLAREEASSRHPKSLRYCPAMLDHQARIFEITCPVDLHLRVEAPSDGSGPFRLINVAGDRSTIRSKHLGKMVSLVSQKEWRNPSRPILQIATPYLMIADEQIYLTQMPPFEAYPHTGWPGLLISGRFPIDVWPRHLMWAFEWFDTKQDLILRRGDPWFYVRFETADPSRPVRLSEAEMTPQLREYLKGLSGVTNYVSRTFSLFSTARQRRPQTLLKPVQR